MQVLDGYECLPQLKQRPGDQARLGSGGQCQPLGMNKGHRHFQHIGQRVKALAEALGLVR